MKETLTVATSYPKPWERVFRITGWTIGSRWDNPGAKKKMEEENGRFRWEPNGCTVRAARKAKNSSFEGTLRTAI